MTREKFHNRLIQLEKVFVVISLLIFTGAIIPLLRAQDTENFEGDPLIQMLFILIYIVIAGVIFVNFRKFIELIKNDIWIILLVLIAVASFFWSVAPEITSRRIVAIIGTTLFGIYLAMRYNLHDILKLLLWSFGIITLLSVIFGVFLPQFGVHSGLHDGAWRGVFTHKNVLAKYMTLSSLVFLVFILMNKGRKRKLLWAGFILSLLLVLLSTSKTGLVMVISFLILIPLFRSLRWKARILIPFFIMVFLTVCSIGILFVGNIEEILGAMGKDITFSGRTELWGAVWSKILQEFWLGYGYRSFWIGWEGESADVYIDTGWMPVHSHNGLLDLWLELGLIGVTTFIISYFLNLKRSTSLFFKIGIAGLFPLIFMTFLFLSNLSESSILRQNNIFWVLYVALTLVMTKQEKTVEKG